MSSLSRTLSRQSNRDEGVSRPKRGDKIKMPKRIRKDGRLLIENISKPWQCSCGKTVKAGNHVIRFHGFQLCSVCGPGKYTDIAGTKGWL
jgi:hypothetical protein